MTEEVINKNPNKDNTINTPEELFFNSSSQSCDNLESMIKSIDGLEPSAVEEIYDTQKRNNTVIGAVDGPNLPN